MILDLILGIISLYVMGSIRCVEIPLVRVWVEYQKLRVLGIGYILVTIHKFDNFEYRLWGFLVNFRNGYVF